MYARLRPNRSPILLPIRMNAADTSASIATAACTPLTVVSRSRTTAEIETFISEVSMTNTNIAIASRMARRDVAGCESGGGTDRRVSHTVSRARRRLDCRVHAARSPRIDGRRPRGGARARRRARLRGDAGVQPVAPDVEADALEARRRGRVPIPDEGRPGRVGDDPRRLPDQPGDQGPRDAAEVRRLADPRAA